MDSDITVFVYIIYMHTYIQLPLTKAYFFAIIIRTFESSAQPHTSLLHIDLQEKPFKHECIDVCQNPLIKTHAVMAVFPWNHIAKRFLSVWLSPETFGCHHKADIS